MVFNFYDWDNTLVFTNKALYFAYLEALKPYGFDFSYDYFMKAIYNDSTAFLKAKGMEDALIAKVKGIKNKLMTKHSFFDLIRENEHIMVNTFQKNAIVTNTSAELVRKILSMKNPTKLERMEFVIGSDTVKSRKPYPNLYIEAFKRIADEFNYEEDELHIWEDSLEGIEAAVRFLRELKGGYNGFNEIKNFRIHHVYDHE